MEALMRSPPVMIEPSHFNLPTIVMASPKSLEEDHPFVDVSQDQLSPVDKFI
jgi:hypothetical protein